MDPEPKPRRGDGTRRSRWTGGGCWISRPGSSSRSRWPSADPKGAAIFFIGLAQSTLTAYHVADRDQGVRSRDADTAIILATLGLFHVAIGIGAVLRFWVRIR